MSDAETIPARLQALLDQGTGTFQALNFGVPGYDIVQEAAVLERKGLAYEPDIVLIFFVANDTSLPNFIRGRHDPISHALDFLVSGFKNASRHKERLVDAPKVEGREYYLRDPDKVPPAYRGMVGVGAYKRAMIELAGLRDKHGFELFVLQKRARKYVTDTCKDLDIPLLSFRSTIDAYMNEHNIESWNGSVLSVSEDDPHPSAVGHKLYAEALFDYLKSQGVLDRATSQ